MEEDDVMTVSLPDDVLLEILVRVKDEPTLFRCATACKRWHHLVADPSFLWCRWPDQDYSSSLVGFLGWQKGTGVGLKSCFVPTPQSPLGPGLRALSSFFTVAPADLFDRAVPLVSRHGFLLVRLEARDARGYPDQKIFQLVVCKLLTGTCHTLPPLELAWDIDDHEFSAYAVLNGADCCSNDESFFKVVIITSDYDNLKYSLHMSSSDKPSWIVRTKCFRKTTGMEDYGIFGGAVVCRGTAHWLFSYCGDPCIYVISLNTQTSHISKIKVPFLIGYVLLSHKFLTLAGNGTLSVLWMQEKGSQLEIWGQQEKQKNVGGTYSEWICTRTIELQELGEETQGRELCVLGEKCGTLFINDDQNMYTANLKTGRMEEVSNWLCKSTVSPWEVMPLEMDWPTIFISRLAATF